VVALAFAALPLGVVAQVVAGAKGAARALDHDHMHLVVGLRPFDRAADLGRGGLADGVELLGPVEHEARDARMLRVLVDQDGVENGHVSCLLWLGRTALVASTIAYRQTTRHRSP
jgi:hypothetical protein